MGNYSRFIRPGYVRITTSYDVEENNLRATAFKNPDTNEVVVVVVNNSTETSTIELTIPGNETLNSRSIYETSDEHDLAELYNGELMNTVTFAPQSVTTLILNGS